MFSELTIDRGCGQPVSLQMAKFVKDKIANGTLASGEKIPTTKEIVKSVGVGPHTVRQAMKRLEQEDIVKCTPKLGTVICEDAVEIIMDSNPTAEVENKTSLPKRFETIGVIGLVQKVDSGVRYCVETAEGITNECTRLGVAAVVLPDEIINMTASEICDVLKAYRCNGLIWSHNSLPQDKTVFDVLDQHGIKTIFRRRGQFNDDRSSIDTDYDSAGYKTGQYFSQNSISNLLIFSHFDFNTAHNDFDCQFYPKMLRSGIQRAFEHNDIDSNIEVDINLNEDKKASQRIHSRLCHLPDNTGVIFTNGFQLLNYLNHTGPEGYELLRKFKVVSISNLAINVELRGVADGLDLMVLIDNFKNTGKMLVSNLMGMLKGYYHSGTTTLTSVDFKHFGDLFQTKTTAQTANTKSEIHTKVKG
ncbi:MAG: winged helix-turn-helix domain-containing protein [Sedimentisphaeraceae bacterium JB056]